MTVFLLSEGVGFPDPECADSSGLLGVGGDLSGPRLLQAYRSGIFPWFSEGQPILWWSPDPRFVLWPERAHLSKKTRALCRQNRFEIGFDRAFDRVIAACAERSRPGQAGTWITAEMINAYVDLHHAGWAHSLECWRRGALVGGLYGIAMGSCFFGESMFFSETGASRVALAALLDRFQGGLIDCQIESPLFSRFGAERMPRARFLQEVHARIDTPNLWKLRCSTC